MITQNTLDQTPLPYAITDHLQCLRLVNILYDQLTSHESGDETRADERDATLTRLMTYIEATQPYEIIELIHIIQLSLQDNSKPQSTAADLRLINYCNLLRAWLVDPHESKENSFIAISGLHQSPAERIWHFIEHLQNNTSPECTTNLPEIIREFTAVIFTIGEGTHRNMILNLEKLLRPLHRMHYSGIFLADIETVERRQLFRLLDIALLQVIRALEDTDQDAADHDAMAHPSTEAKSTTSKSDSLPLLARATQSFRVHTDSIIKARCPRLKLTTANH